ncbi:MAG: NfeD family protein [Oscillospiraceae bacterium]|nr:NfeD family protein [Oscillospiraceae bacterium]
MVVFWIVVLAAALILEAATFALISIWFAAGAVGALIAAAMGVPTIWQFVIFAFLAGLLLIFTRPLLKKLFPSKFIPTNSELEVGKTAVVIEAIDNGSGKGRVRLGGVNWAAVSSSGDSINEGEVVKVTEVRSAKLVVERSSSDSNKENN